MAFDHSSQTKCCLKLELLIWCALLWMVPIRSVHSMGTHILHAGPTCFIQPSDGGEVMRHHRGTCYSSLVCKQKGGVASGKCGGLGNDCCIFPQTCDSISFRNSTYFTNANYPLGTNRSTSGDCSLIVHRTPGVHPICQLRLDFIEYQIEGLRAKKSTVAETSGTNERESDDSIASNVISQSDNDGDNCGNDRISLRTMHTSEDIVAPVCARKIGRHVNIDVQKHIGPFVLTVHGRKDKWFSRRWNIMINQIECFRLHGSGQPTATLVNRNWDSPAKA